MGAEVLILGPFILTVVLLIGSVTHAVWYVLSRRKYRVAPADSTGVLLRGRACLSVLLWSGRFKLRDFSRLLCGY